MEAPIWDALLVIATTICIRTCIAYHAQITFQVVALAAAQEAFLLVQLARPTIQ